MINLDSFYWFWLLEEGAGNKKGGSDDVWIPFDLSYASSIEQSYLQKKAICEVGEFRFDL